MIYLRKLTINDLDYLNSIENNTSFWKYSFQNQFYSNDDLIQFIYDSHLPVEETSQIRFVICKTATDQPLGFIDLFEIDFANSKAGVSILIADKNHRSRGYGKMSLKKIIKFSRDRLNINNFYCNIYDYNIQSINCFKSVGFTEISKNSVDKSLIQLQCN
tara:strand:+ start:1083 stop:1562 length:480 start_codon:yes stop_codon:yes gene_type:complete